jgi:outer membrane protein TolC
VYALQSIAIEQEIIRVEERLARSSIAPSLSLNGSLGTRYSTALKEDPFDFQSAPMSFRNQMDVNLFQNVGFQLNIPIFNNGEYLKSAQLRRIKEDELLAQSELMAFDLERKNLEFNLLFTSALARHQQIENSTENMEVIYNLSVESYKSGRTTFSELEDVFIEWQTEVLNLKTAKYELIRLKLLEAS